MDNSKISSGCCPGNFPEQVMHKNSAVNSKHMNKCRTNCYFCHMKYPCFYNKHNREGKSSSWILDHSFESQFIM